MSVILDRIREVRKTLEYKRSNPVAAADSAESVLDNAKFLAAEHLLTTAEEFIRSNRFSNNSTEEFQKKLLLFTIEYTEILVNSTKLQDDDVLLFAMGLLHLRNNYNTRSVRQTAAGIALIVLGLALAITLLAAPPAALVGTVALGLLVPTGFLIATVGSCLATFIAAFGKQASIAAAASNVLIAATVSDKLKNPENYTISARGNRFFASNPYYERCADSIWEDKTRESEWFIPVRR